MSPTYEFVCEACQRKEWYVTQKYDTTPPDCEHCGEEMKIVISAPAVVLKGSGWATKEGK